jgi:hypothetical protein
MKIFKKFLLILIISILLFTELRSEPSYYAINIIKILSSKEYLGRQGGTLENEKVLNFIKEELINIGIPYSHIFIQEFPLNIFFLEEMPILEVYEKGKIIWKGKYRKNFRDVFTGTVKIYGNINYVNYGLRIDDYSKSEGKISVSLLGYEDPKDKNLDRVDYRAYLANFNSSIGLILVLDEIKKYLILQKSLFLNNLPLPVIYLSHDAWELIKKFYDKNSNIKIKYEINYKTRTNILKNLFVLFPGKDDKYIIISAHYDHIGRDPDGSFYPGANDNASGVSVILEVIKILKERNIKTKYNIVFSFFDGEEYGLKGSDFYIKNPIFPINKTILNINLDCLGRGKYLYLVYNYLAEEFVERLRESDESLILLGEHSLLSQSDQYSFVKMGIPSIFITRANEDLSMPDLHQKTDTYEKIPYLNLWKVIDLLIKFLGRSE